MAPVSNPPMSPGKTQQSSSSSSSGSAALQLKPSRFANIDDDSDANDVVDKKGSGGSLFASMFGSGSNKKPNAGFKTFSSGPLGAKPRTPVFGDSVAGASSAS